MYYFYGIPLLQIKIRLLGIAACSLVGHYTDYANTVTIISKYVVCVSWFINWKRPSMELHLFQHNNYCQPAASD
jgi:hypothetical protein